MSDNPTQKETDIRNALYFKGQSDAYGEILQKIDGLRDNPFNTMYSDDILDIIRGLAQSSRSVANDITKSIVDRAAIEKIIVEWVRH